MCLQAGTLRWLVVSVLSVCACSAQEPIERIKNCGRMDLCKARPPELLLSPDVMTTKTVGSLPCFCDERCAEFGDCCLDKTPSLGNTNQTWKCVRLSGNKDNGIYVIGDCKTGDDYLVRLCKKDLKDTDYHYTLDVPVYSVSSENYYANVYCALCNSEKASSLEPIRLSVKCETNSTTLEKLISNGTYQKGKLYWKIKNDTCSLVAENEIKKARQCVAALSTCPETADSLTAKKCTAYALLVQDESQLYKNAHCASCYNISKSELACWHGQEFRTKYASLEMILDFNWDFDTCALPKSVWDGFHRRCTNMCIDTCSLSSEVHNETECIPNHTDITLNIEGYLTTICISISIVFLLLHLILSFFLPHSKNLPGQILNSLCFSLIIGKLLFLFGIHPCVDVPEDLCESIAIFLQFFFLSSFFWMNVMSIDIWRTFSNSSLKGRSVRSHTRYSAYAWGSSGVITIASIIADVTTIVPEDFRPYYAAVPDVCWYGNRVGLAIFFFFPTCFLLLLNIIMFGITVCWFQKQHRNSEFMKTSGRKEYTRLWLYIKLFIIMGLTWVCEMVSSLTERPNLQYPSIILNGLQGTFIFIMFDMKNEVFEHIFKKLRLKKSKKEGTIHKKCTSSDSTLQPSAMNSVGKK